VANWGKIGEPLSMLCINLQLVHWMWRGLCINLIVFVVEVACFRLIDNIFVPRDQFSTITNPWTN